MKHPADLRSLHSFVTVAREGNVSRAAALLHLTQPAVSLQLKRLSEYTGLVLFRRTARGLELTRDGETLLKKAERVLEAVEEFSHAARRMTGTLSGTLRIGTIVDPDFIRLGRFLAELLEAAPGLQAELVHGMSGDVPVRLQRGEIDMGFMLDESLADMPVQGAPFHHQTLTRFRYLVIAPAGWERRVAGLGWAGLAELPWVGTPPASVHHRLLERRFRETGAEQNRVALVDQEPSMLAMVRSGVGLSLCRESIALYEKQANGLVVVEGMPLDTTLAVLVPETRRYEPAIDLSLVLLSRIWTGLP
ncbi:MAG: DNA-binding transcriptional LysR family regulator [Limimaricola cinnabarinus]|jgi:DNA-binding transcriptional LysR family regulator|uniref:LysR family transcriptional regulator n=1 Tax=Limimaricola cinnabarinus TaxID=1125964 RepID=UPI0039E3A84F